MLAERKPVGGHYRWREMRECSDRCFFSINEYVDFIEGCSGIGHNAFMVSYERIDCLLVSG